MSLSHGGHLSHGFDLSLSGRVYRFVHYRVDRGSEQIDYEAVLDLARRERPRLIVVGGSAYPRRLDFQRFAAIGAEVGARLMVDQAHIGGLVAAGVHPSPVGYADYVTGTTYKTLGGGKGGYILCRPEYAKAIDRAVFPGVQGSFGPHTVAAKAVAFRRAMTAEFREMQRRVVASAARLANALRDAGWRLVAGGTDTHLVLLDVKSGRLTGRQAEEALGAVGIYANRNLIPFDENPPLVASGIRIGTPAVVARGFGDTEIDELADVMVSVLAHPGDSRMRLAAQARVAALCRRFPIYGYQGESVARST
jgi:glycine hydroxymethyltransferase